MAFPAQVAYAELHEEFAQQQLIASEEREAWSHRSDGKDEARGWNGLWDEQKDVVMLDNLYYEYTVTVL